MPYLKISTNVQITQQQSGQLLTDLSQLLAKETGKPERYVMIEVAGGLAMAFGGNTQALAYLECKSIGLSLAQTKALAASIPQVLSESLALPQDRVYIEFSSCPAEFWGWNGSTFA